jgi:hypothetical protein
LSAPGATYPPTPRFGSGAISGPGRNLGLNLQSAHDLSKAERDNDYSEILPREAVA